MQQQQASIINPSLRVAQLADGRRAVIIRTSDRINFKQCRRKWGWSSHLKRNLGPKYLASPLWFGSAIHFALEDWHGYNYFGRPARAFMAYCIATSKQFTRDLPDDAQEHYDLGIKMMDYYVDHWSRFRPATATYWCPPAGYDGPDASDPAVAMGGYGPTLPNGEANPKFHASWVPQVEVNFEIPIPLDEYPIIKAFAERQGCDCVLYRGTVDRVGIDEEGALWCVEYKTAKKPEHYHYQTDPQITTYCWAMSHTYVRPVAGVEYQQFVKNSPETPRILGSGKLSTASNLVSSAPLYRAALEKMYGSNETCWPQANKDKLTEFMMAETEHRDRFIVREKIRRNRHMMEAEAQKILLEAEDMLNPDLPLYPNPTRQCAYMCSFNTPCVSMDDGGDWETELEQEFSERDQAADRLWRKRLPSIESLLRMLDAKEHPNLAGIQGQFRDMDSLKRASIEAGEEEMNIPTFKW
jgi:hypothetical protein